MDLVSDNFGYDVWEMEDIPSGTTSPIWLLGERFKYEDLDIIRKKIISIIWITYRKGFAPIGPSVYQYTSDKGESETKNHKINVTTDDVTMMCHQDCFLIVSSLTDNDFVVGFGCMIRCGQMLLAEALKRIHIERDWSWSKDTNDSTYLNIVNRFEDNPDAPFSFHRISEIGQQEMGKKISDWFSPNEISQVLK